MLLFKLGDRSNLAGRITRKELASIYNRSVPAIEKALARQGLTRPLPGAKRALFLDASQISRLQERSITIKGMAQELGVGSQTVARALRQQNVSLEKGNHGIDIKEV